MEIFLDTAEIDEIRTAARAAQSANRVAPAPNAARVIERT